MRSVKTVTNSQTDLGNSELISLMSLVSARLGCPSVRAIKEVCCLFYLYNITERYPVPTSSADGRDHVIGHVLLFVCPSVKSTQKVKYWVDFYETSLDYGLLLGKNQ